MAYYATTSFAILVVMATFMAFLSSTLASDKSLPSSTISAAPALLPDPSAPLSAPPPSSALSPDIYPTFPSPGGSELSPSESSVPLIPSSPSPPNPDSFASPGPGFALPPSEILPESYSSKLNVPVFLSSLVVLFGGISVVMAF